MSVATREERGDTVSAAVRWPLRLIVVLLAVSGIVTIAVVRHREEAPGAGAPTTAVAPSDTVTVTVDRTDATREADLVAGEDARLRRATTGPAVGISRRDGSVILGARRTPYTLPDLIRAGAAVRRSATVVEIEQPVVVRRDAHLLLRAPGQTLRLRSGSHGFASIVAWGGSLTVAGASGHPITLVAWDDATSAVDGVVADGRAYLRVKGGRLSVSDAAVQHLGFWSGRTGGVALTGGDDGETTGTVSRTTLFDLHSGLFADDADTVDVASTTVDRAQWAGVYVSGSRNVRLDDVTVSYAGAAGIDVRDGSTKVALDGVSVTGSVGYGIRIDGRPLATGVNAAGYGPENFAGLTMSRTRVSDNRSGGVLIRGMDQVAISGLTAIEDRVALQVSGSSGLLVDSSALTSATHAAVLVDSGARRVQLDQTRVEAPEIGVRSTGAGLSIDGGTITVSKGHGVSVEGGSARVRGTEIDGRGSAAVEHHDARVTSTDIAGEWHYRPDAVLWLERHSALLPFLPLIPVLVLGTLLVWRRHRDQIRLRSMLAEAMTARGRGLVEAYEAPVPSPGRDLLEVESEGSAAAFAVTAVLDFGHPPGRVARVLGVPTSRVRTWVEEAQSPERGMSERVGDPA